MSIQDNIGDTSKMVERILQQAAKLVSSKQLARTRWNTVSGQHPERDWNLRSALGVYMVARGVLGLPSECDTNLLKVSQLVGDSLQHQWLNMEIPIDQRTHWLYKSPPKLVGNLAPLVSKRYDMEVSPSRVRSMKHRTAFPRHLDGEMWELAQWWRDQQETSGEKQSVFGMNVYSYIENAPEVSYIAYNKCDQNGRIYADSRGELAPCYSKVFRAVFGCPEHRVDDATLKAYTAWCESEYGLPITDFCKLYTEAKDSLKAGYSLVAIRHSRTLGELLSGKRTTQTIWELDAAHSGQTLIRASEGILKDRHCNTKNADYVHAHKQLAFALRHRFPHLRHMSFADMKAIIVKPLTNRTNYGAGPIPVVEAFLGIPYQGGRWRVDDDRDIMEYIPEHLMGAVQGVDGADLKLVMDAIVERVKAYQAVYHSEFPFIRKFNKKVLDFLKEQPHEGRIISSWDWSKHVCPYKLNEDAILKEDGIEITGKDMEWNIPKSTICFPWIPNPLTGEAAGGIHMGDSNVLCTAQDMDEAQGILSDGVHDAVISPLGDGLQVQKNYRNALVQRYTDPDEQLLVRMGVIKASDWRAPKLAKDAHLLA